MHRTHRAAARQRRRVQHHAANTDSNAMFNLLTGPELLNRVEAVLPTHRERDIPPTETLSMFLARSLSADAYCQQAVKRLVNGLTPCSTDTGATARRVDACR